MSLFRTRFPPYKRADVDAVLKVSSGIGAGTCAVGAAGEAVDLDPARTPFLEI
jgi:hypothetical protein